MGTISAYLTCNNNVENEFTLFEAVESALGFADQVIYLDGGSTDGTLTIFKEKFKEEIDLKMIRIYENKWEIRMGKHMLALQKNIALSHCSCDWAVLIDADECYHEKDFDTIRNLTEIPNINAWRFNTLHFYKEYNLINENPNYYKGKVYMVKNNMGFHHGSACESMDDDLITFDRKDALIGCGKANVDVFHYGKVRSEECMNKKHNSMEIMYHPEWKEEKWEWKDMEYAVEFKGNHPAVMKDRIECNKDTGKIRKLYLE